MKFLPFLLAPTLALCGTYSGAITLLDGTPVAGAVIKVGTDSVTTTADGSFALARAAGIASRPGKTIASTSLSASPVTSHLAVENGHPRLSFAGGDIRGRARASVSPADARQAAGRMQAPRPAAARSQEDTLTVYWKGKRITVLPVPADTGNVTFKIDTAWKDDAGIPWNPRIAYGSLFDTRDSQTYRTVTIGTQTWMAENLNYAAANSWWFKGVDTSEFNEAGSFDSLDENLTHGAKYGRYYQWSGAMNLPDSCLTKPCSTTATGVCPANWHVPSNDEWSIVQPGNGLSTADSIIGQAIKSVKGWGWLASKGVGDAEGLDLIGFRAVHSGLRLPTSVFITHGGWWANTDLGIYNTKSAWYHAWHGPYALGTYEGNKTYGQPVRCIKDTP